MPPALRQTRVLHVVGARPNFMKTAPIMAAMSRQPDEFEQLLLHTGQHYGDTMSQVFFEDLVLPSPHVCLGVGSGSHAEQVARIMTAFERVLLECAPDVVMVVGDVNSTLACALVCAKSGTPVAHVEAGLRSFDRSMPEEINRLLTDQIADLHFTPSRDGDENLQREGIPRCKVHFVGNVLIDSLVRVLDEVDRRPILATLGLEAHDYVLVTLHRPANVDRVETLSEILAALRILARDLRVVFPVHPRTRQRIDTFALEVDAGLGVLEPFGYLDFLALEKRASIVITDSGGVQEETTYLGVPCLTLRPNTERPVTLTVGTNRLAGSRTNEIVDAAHRALSGPAGAHAVPELWDGHAADRIVQVLQGWRRDR